MGATVQKKPEGRRPVWVTILRVLGTLFLIGIITAGMIACLAAMYIKIVILPQSDLQLTDLPLNLTTTMYYTDPATGQPVQMEKIHGAENRILVSYDQIPDYMVKAAVAIEDRRFYEHNGVDWIRTFKGVINMFTGQSIQGGSTITQQLIKNRTGEKQVTVKRKITEIFKALKLEENYPDKNVIMENYLNTIYLGQGCFGVCTAANTYFGKDISELSLAECASIIGITNNPSRYDPFFNREKNKERQELILRQMLTYGFISQEEHDAAVAEELQFARGEKDPAQTVVFSWYADAVISQLIRDLQDHYNLSETAASDMVYSGGLEIYTCMNPNVQQYVDQVYSNRDVLNYSSSSGQPIQSAVTVVENATGHVVALAGGVGPKEGSRVLNRAISSQRPPGSSIKPLSVYGPALDLGAIRPNSMRVDSPYDNYDGHAWPVNAYGSYRGSMTISEALRVSSNTVAVKVLAEDVTPETSYEYMTKNFHIPLVQSRQVSGRELTDIALAPLALGGLTEGVTTYRMAAAYSVFPRGGTYIEPALYTKVVDSKGNIVLENTGEGTPALKASTTYYMNNMLRRVVSAGTGTGAKFSGMDIAGKTGTTSSRKDLWFVGYTPYYTAAVWTGYDQQERLAPGLGNPSTAMWRNVMKPIHDGLEYKEFGMPDDGSLVTVNICSASGKLAGQYCGGYITTATVLAEDAPTGYCNVHTRPRPTAPKPFDPNDSSTWPDDPSFDPNDSATWPGGTTTDPGTTDPAVTPTPDPGTTDPAVTPTPDPGTTDSGQIVTPQDSNSG